MKRIVLCALSVSMLWTDASSAQVKYVNPGEMSCKERKALGLCKGPCNDIPGDGSSCPKGFVSDRGLLIENLSKSQKAKIIELLNNEK